MRNKLTITITAMLALFGAGLLTSAAQAQEMDALLRELGGKVDAPQRSEAQLTEAYQKAVAHLLPLMGADDVASRYNHQIALQDMGSHAARPGAEMERDALARVLIETLEQAEMPNTVRYWIVLQLERIGKDESVAALARLMTDDDMNLRDCARRALQANPDAGATDALLKALDEIGAADTTWNISLIDALAARRASKAVASLTKAIDHRDPAVRVAAVSALSQISGPQSARALIGITRKPFGPLSVQAAQGLLEIARERVAHNDYNNAVGVYAAVYTWATKMSEDPNTPNPVAVRAAAINGLIRCDIDGGPERAVEAINDADATIRAAAVQAARQAPTKAPAEALVALLPTLEPGSQVQVLGLVADRGDLSSVPAVVTMLKSQDRSVQQAAIETLTTLGGDTAAEGLLSFAANAEKDSQEAAGRGLALMVGPLVEEVIATHAASGDTKSRALAIGLLARRRTPGATEAILGYATEQDTTIAQASFKALVEVADSVDIARLAKLLTQTTDDDVRKSCTTAMRAALSRAGDKNAAAETMLGQMRASNAQEQLWLLSCLDALGGPAALKAVADAAESTDQNRRDTGIRTLSNWPDFEAAAPLLALAAKSETSLTHYVLATRGALRLITAGGSAPLETRAALCFKAFDQARRDDEKRAAIATMGALPSQDVAKRLLALAEEGTLKAEAGLAAVELAGNLLDSDRSAARDLAQKVRDLNISDEVNRRAEAVASGRRARRR